ncbi:uncharacterized protein RSE6_00294 [Rhynchosporium secalis]|uniref:Alpha/beta hydrolase fold-3 domain-containing protein n=1 Tax=Rhynchosporium secalis TaxID=38038 RepID=A0A1E1LWM6_RHYSE|nr:uncharacterized protein RSE6_00294 [Rhynchosporium secalis]
MDFLPPSHVLFQYLSEYISHSFITPSQDPILNVALGPSGPFKPPIVHRGSASSKTYGENFGLAGIHGDKSDPLFDPFLYGTTDRGHRDLPPAYFQVCGLVPPRDVARVYERVLREESGVQTRLDVYKGLDH